MAQPSLAVVVVCHDSAAALGRSLPALVAQLEPGDELVLVDNASADGTRETARALAPQATLVDAGANLGFAGGCHAGARASRGELLLFLNPDANPAPDCVARLRAAAGEHSSWGAWQPLVTMPDGATINSAGNVAHFLGVGWAGLCGQPVAAAGTAAREVGFASGAALVVRREAWNATGGFDARYFMYGEDLDLCLRLRLAGWRIGLVPAARVAHDYEFAKGGYKWFLLERNRWWTILGDYPAALLALLLPALLAFELVVLAVAWRGGWLRVKVRAQRAVARELPAAWRRRRAVQAGAATAAEFAGALEASLESPYLGAPARLPVLPALQAAYWRGVLAVLRRL